MPERPEDVAAEVQERFARLALAPHDETTFHGWTGYKTSPSTEGGFVSARKPAR